MAHTFLLRSGSSYFYSHFVDQNKVKLDDIRARGSRDRPDREGLACLLAVLGLHGCTRAFFSWGYSLVVVYQPRTVVVSLLMKHGVLICGTQS